MEIFIHKHHLSFMFLACLLHLSTTLSVFASSKYNSRVAVADWTDTHVIFGNHPDSAT